MDRQNDIKNYLQENNIDMEQQYKTFFSDTTSTIIINNELRWRSPVDMPASSNDTLFLSTGKSRYFTHVECLHTNSSQDSSKINSDRPNKILLKNPCSKFFEANVVYIYIYIYILEWDCLEKMTIQSSWVNFWHCELYLEPVGNRDAATRHPQEVSGAPCQRVPWHQSFV
jgi:hypothetical protein